MPKYDEDARNIAQGIKKQKLDETYYRIGIFFSIMVACLIGYAASNVKIGFAVFVVLSIWNFKSYYAK